VIGLVLASVAVAGGWIALARFHAAPQEQREQIVEMIRAGQLTEKDQYGHLILPDQFAGATVHGEVTVFEDPFTVFFLTETFFGPDPYCGYEYTEGAPNPDPHHSGRGSAEPLGGGWYRVCAR
jgi:hypothetical protein